MNNLILFVQTDATLFEDGAKGVIVEVKSIVLHWIQNIPVFLIQSNVILELEEVGLEVVDEIFGHATLGFDWINFKGLRHEEWCVVLGFKRVSDISWVVGESRCDRWSDDDRNPMLCCVMLIMWVLKLN